MGSLLTFLLGGAIGGALGLLYAPASGEETRRRIKFQTDEMTNRAMSEMQKVRDEANSAVEKLKHEVEESRNKVVSAFEAGRQAFVEEKGRLEQQ